MTRPFLFAAAVAIWAIVAAPSNPSAQGAPRVRMLESEGEAASYWPRWRGPSGQGLVSRGEYPDRWSETELVKWKVRGAGPWQFLARRLGRSHFPDDSA